MHDGKFDRKHCGHIGHSSFFSLEKQTEQNRDKSRELVDGDLTDENLENIIAATMMASEFGSWMHAPSRSRRPNTRKEGLMEKGRIHRSNSEQIRENKLRGF